MSAEDRKPEQDPAEGSREVVDRELDRQDEKQEDEAATRDAEPKPTKA